jgi:DNA-directed RNA polymerase subunit RPC12/RpoP
MEEVLKGLQGKSMTKKKLFDFLADINLEDIYGKKENIVYGETKSIEVENKDEPKKEEAPKEYKCQACMKLFTTDSSLKRHHDRSPVCVDWISIPEKTDVVQLTKGLHLIIDELLEKSICNNGELECKYCKSKFINKGNHHKHFNSATVCNRLAYKEFKNLFNNL